MAYPTQSVADGPIGVGLIGLGTVGGGVARLLQEQAPLYEARLGRRIELRRVLVRDSARAAASGDADPALLTVNPDTFFETDGVDIIVEAMGGVDVAGQMVERAIRSGRHVVTANKALLAARGAAVFKLARDAGVCIAFEASCAGGIPIVTALQFGLMANRVEGLYGILNGTCNYILTQMTRNGTAYVDALAEAQAAGYAEADPTLDVTGRDAAQKLAVLASLAFGVRLSGEEVPSRGIDGLSLEDLRFAAELGYDTKLLAIAEATGPTDDAEPSASIGGEPTRVSVSVEPCLVPKRALLAQVAGAFNAVSIRGHAVGHTMYYGPGAGRFPTASAVVSDLLNIASGWYPAAFAGLRLTPDLHPPARVIPAEERVAPYYLRLHAMDRPGVVARIASALGERGISIGSFLQHEQDVGRFVPVVLTTHAARWGDVREAVAAIAAMDEIEGEPVTLRIVIVE